MGIQGFRGAVDQVGVLRNGASVHLRPIRPDDAPRLRAHALANVDYRERMALVAQLETGREPTLIGVARYGPTEEAALADIGLVVEDGSQGLGLGSILLTESSRQERSAASGTSRPTC